MTWVAAAGGAILLAASAGAAGRAPAAHRDQRPLAHAGRWFVDAQRRVVIGHGTNIVAKATPYLPAATGVGDDDAAFLQAHGFTMVRLGVIPAGLEPSAGRFDEHYLASIADSVRILWKHGIRSMLDFHQDLLNERFQGQGLPSWMIIDDGLPAEPTAGFPGNYFAMAALNRAFDHLWANDPDPRGIGLQDDLAQMWAHIAKRFNGDPAILGYDVLNEPWPGTIWPTCFPPTGCSSFDKASLAPLYAKVTTAIRSVDRDHLVVYEPLLPFGYSGPTGVGKPAGDKAVFGFHAYCLATVGVPESLPARTICDYVEQTTFANAETQGRASGDALLLSEFGATSDQVELNKVIRAADDHAISWMEWQYSSTGTTNGPSGEALIGDPHKPPTGANLNAGNLAVLDEPYPQLVAGTPSKYAFDPASRTFVLTYDVHSPVDGRPVLDALTDIYLPAALYGRGARVTVTGASVVSRTATHLLLRNSRGASVVTVAVR